MALLRREHRANKRPPEILAGLSESQETRVWGLGFGVWGLGFRVETYTSHPSRHSS